MARKAKAESEAEEAEAAALHLRRTVAALAALCGESVEDSMGLTEAVRTVFQNHEGWIPPPRSRKEQVEILGVSRSLLKNPDASVLSVLNRLVTAGDIETATKKFRFAGEQIGDYKAWKRTQPPEMSEDDIPF